MEDDFGITTTNQLSIYDKELIDENRFNIQYPEFEFTLEENPEFVWPATGKNSTGLMVAAHAIEFFSRDKANSHNMLMDVGCGSGAIGLATLLSGIAYNAMFVDNNPHALDLTLRNLRHNKIPNRGVIRNSEEITGLSPIMFDILVANCPMNPKMAVHSLSYAELSNGNGSRGDQLVTHIIRNLHRVVKENGSAVLTFSSRNGGPAICEELDERFGPENWEILNSADENKKKPVRHELDPNYMGSFIDRFNILTLEDGIARVFHEDQFGNPYLDIASSTDDATRAFVTNPENGELLVRKINGMTGITFSRIENGELKVLEKHECPLVMETLWPRDSRLYHDYYIVGIKVRSRKES